MTGLDLQFFNLSNMSLLQIFPCLRCGFDISFIVEYLEFIINMSGGIAAGQLIKSINSDSLEDYINLKLISSSLPYFSLND
jgi:hypothetical protein